MNCKENVLVVIENGQLSTYNLDDKLQWTVGRPSKENCPDIKLYSTTISRKHGRFKNKDGYWLYVDGNGKNGTVYNKKRIKAGLNGVFKPQMLNNGDVLVFGGGEEEIINSSTVWAMFLESAVDSAWHVVDTKGYETFVFTDGDKEITYNRPNKGLVVNMVNGIGIYMGDVTYLSGNINVKGE